MATRLTRKTIGAVCLGLSLVAAAPSAVAVGDVLEIPAHDTQLATEYLLNDVAEAGERIVAVGERGHIIYSDDDGRTWTQAEVPVSVTLTAVDFANETHGWAVGHSGAVLHSSDAGETWALQLTGIRAMELSIEAKEKQVEVMEEEIAEAPEEEKGDLEWALDDLLFTIENMQSDMEIGPVNPLLSVWFENEDHGFVTGAYGMVLRTTDGGESWKDMSGEILNPRGFHLNAITQVTGGGLVIAGEAGFIQVSTDRGDTWETSESPYTGSFFGVIGTGKVNEIMAFGLRGNIVFSSDLGRSWKTVPIDSTATLNDGVADEYGRIILVGNGGAVLVSTSGGETFKHYFRDDREGVMDVVPVKANHLILFGEQGVSHADETGTNL